ncbi:xanthine dehydrogenase small subunit [Spirosoma harenae]
MASGNNSDNDLITFILNNREIRTTMFPGTPVLDFVRYHKHLMGTKIGCREGDCGACTVLVGNLAEEGLRYRTVTSCLMPLGNVQGKHIVTIEGLNKQGLNPVQQAMSDQSATQCGFCTPGFVMSLAGFCLSKKEPTAQNAMAAIDGNICRCTGYKSIERAATQIAHLLEKRTEDNPIDFVVNQGLFPDYFASIPDRLQALAVHLNGEQTDSDSVAQRVGGGTDVYVQKHDEIKEATIQFLSERVDLKGITQEEGQCIIGASTTVTDLMEAPIIRIYFPDFTDYTKLVSSTPIRNMATIGGNFINASPIGDLTIFFLALDAQLTFLGGNLERVIPLRALYKGYKLLDSQPDEYLKQIRFDLPTVSTRFNFEKVSKRTHLDIASVNSAMRLDMDGDRITKVSLSAGGVAPIPKRLDKTEAWLTGQRLSEDLIITATKVAQTDISPISDARGSEAYKRLLLSQLIKAHFIKLFPRLKVEQLLVQ